MPKIASCYMTTYGGKEKKRRSKKKATFRRVVREKRKREVLREEKLPSIAELKLTQLCNKGGGEGADSSDEKKKVRGNWKTGMKPGGGGRGNMITCAKVRHSRGDRQLLLKKGAFRASVEGGKGLEKSATGLL